MTREESGAFAILAKAYSEGKNIEMWDDILLQCDLIDNPSFTYPINRYRIKEEPKYRPFKDAEEYWQEMLKHKPFGWIQSRIGEILDVWKVRPTGIMLPQSDCGFNCALNDYFFADGTPFGIKEEE